ncbi:chemotaxis protein [Malaciobacter halophilus]|uniref:Chemotaxis protein n=1 Tax=Malaciobacter halophilus TaxID=197482 RepID=A0A2N1J228_9BACT|nr:methyl-accepting chemotaxis protein [Malaciobacter halophilus]AXH10127.1 Cache sensor-containing MCP-domain signal transduction protein [Malaciobacter halophilus]PKI80609.1 chemotaxis protein [Malaciobacter halophilus]
MAMFNSIKSKLMTLVVLPVFIAILITTVITVSLTYKNSEETIKDFENSVVNEKKELLKNQIMTIHTIAEQIIKNSKTKQEAREEIIKVASSARFLDGSGYFFAYEKKDDGFYFGFHGTKPQLNGQKTDIKKEDIKGFAFREALINSANDDNHFVEYYYKKPNTNKLIKKMAFSKSIDKFNWTLVTGIYLDDIEQKVTKIEKRVDEDVNTLIITLVSIVFAILIVLVLIVSYISKVSLIEPLEVFEKGLLSFLSFLNKEKKSVELIEVTTKDEIGIMTKQINENIKKIKQTIEQDNLVLEDVTKVVNDVSSGILSNKVEAKTSNTVINQLTQNLNTMITNLENIIMHTIDVLKSYEQRDFTKVTNMSCQGHLCTLMSGVNNLGVEISKMLNVNLHNGETLKSSSNKLSSNMIRLTTSANEQAVSLEQSAANLEEITQTMRENSSNINELATNSSSLKDEVSRGKELSRKTTNSMEDINNQVQAIIESITIIDQISFQTNILSLNAAVEAATAGEAGKGFAVVAQEVRNLANRSAQAASKIKDLVDSATISTTNGKEVVEQMYKGFESLNDNIMHTTKIVETVTYNSNEQMKGLEQINSAISQLDKTTQENALIATQTNEVVKTVENMSNQIANEVRKNNFVHD